ncbi:MAG: DUF493 family protein [Desulfohalobiaceae bacterium]
MPSQVQNFKQRLNEVHSWPCNYMFKFIVPEHNSEQIMDLFESRDQIYTRHSKNGKYVCITAKCRVHSSEEVVAVYEAAAQVKGVLSL